MSDQPWHVHEGLLDEDSFIFTTFHINSCVSQQESSDIIKRLHTKLVNQFQLWQKNFSWINTIPTIELVDHEGYSYIYGEMKGTNTDDEWLVVQMVIKSCAEADLYTHFWDSDGEFLLVEAAGEAEEPDQQGSSNNGKEEDAFPEWLEPSIATNRVWWNNSQILLIPQTYYTSNPLSLKQALHFLERMIYQTVPNVYITSMIHKKISHYPMKSISSIRPVKTSISQEAYKYISKYPSVVYSSLVSLLNTSEVPRVLNVNKSKTKVILDVPVLAYHMANHYFQTIQQDTNSLDDRIGEYIESGLMVMMRQDDRFAQHFSKVIKEKNDSDIFNTYNLQKLLLEKGEIKEFIEPATDEDLMGDKDFKNEETVIERLKFFFEDSDAGLQGVNNQISSKTNNDGHDDTSDEEDVDEREQFWARQDIAAREYFKSENVDIDEDDFFEFFLKEALNLSPDDIEEYRNKGETSKIDSTNKYNDDSDYKTDSSISDTEEERRHNGFGGDDDDDDDVEIETMKNFMKSLQATGGLNGPASSLIQSMGADLLDLSGDIKSST